MYLLDCQGVARPSGALPGPRSRRWIFFVLILLSWRLPGPEAASIPAPPDLLWPLGIRAGLAASFGEYRGDRFHGGLDLSTGGVIGQEVFAAADGELFRLKIEWRGYGNAVYLRHAGGWVTVYAHLDRLENRDLDLEDRIAARRRATGERYPGDIYLSHPIPVSRGQLLGWSGQSGAGGPHLHFELRDPGNRPVDPLRRTTGWGRDPDAPVLQALTIITSNPDGLVDGHLRRLRIPLQFDNGEYSAAVVPFVDGPFIAELEAMDPGGNDHRLGVGRLRAGLDDGTGFELDLDAFGFEDSRQAGLVFDLDTSGFSPTVYTYRLVRAEGNILARGGPRFEPAGTGLHTLGFDAADAAGNRAVGRIHLLAAPAPRLRNARIGKDPGGGLVLSFELRDGGRRGLESLQGEPLHLEVQYAVVPSTTYRPLPLAEPLPSPPVPLPLPGGETGREVSFRYRLRCGDYRTRWRLLPAPPTPDPSPVSLERASAWSLDLSGDVADLRIVPPSPVLIPPAVALSGAPGRAPAGLPMEWDENGLVASLSLAPVGSDPEGIELQGVGSDAIQESFPVRLFRPDPDRAFHLTAFHAELDLPSGAGFGRGAMALHPESIAATDGLVLRGGPVRFAPDGLILRRDGRLRLQPDSGSGRPERLGIYRWDPVRESWRFQGPVEPGGGLFDRIPIRRGGTYALLEDVQAPRLGRSYPRPGGSAPTAGGPFWVQVEDTGKGLDWDGVRFLIDDEPVVAVYDPDRDRAETVAIPDLSPGSHRLQIAATDRAGNRSRPVTIDFVAGPAGTE